jgi:hypothetical protein
MSGTSMQQNAQIQYQVNARPNNEIVRRCLFSRVETVTSF